MEPDHADDLPLRANTNHIRVRHYVLDLTVQLHTKVIAGSIVLFLEPVVGATDRDGVGSGRTDNQATAGSPCDAGCLESTEGSGSVESTVGEPASTMSSVGTGARAKPQTAPAVANPLSDRTSHKSAGDDEDFTLVLDCCDLRILHVEALDVTSVAPMSTLLDEVGDRRLRDRSAAMLQKLVSMPSADWRWQHRLFSACSRAAPSSPEEAGSVLEFHTDPWSLQVRQRGVRRPGDFPRALRVRYETRPAGRSVRWTRDQDERCVI